MSSQRDAFDRAIRCWNSGDLDGYLQLYDDTIRIHGLAPEPLDKAAARAAYEGVWAALPPHPHLEIHETVEDASHLCCRFTMTGVHGGELAGVPATGVAVTQPGITILRFAGDRCVERWTCADMLAVLTQIGALPG
jgi:predicted ester cyclase